MSTTITTKQMEQDKNSDDTQTVITDVTSVLITNHFEQRQQERDISNEEIANAIGNGECLRVGPNKYYLLDDLFVVTGLMSKTAIFHAKPKEAFITTYKTDFYSMYANVVAQQLAKLKQLKCKSVDLLQFTHKFTCQDIVKCMAIVDDDNLLIGQDKGIVETVSLQTWQSSSISIGKRKVWHIHPATDSHQVLCINSDNSLVQYDYQNQTVNKLKSNVWGSSSIVSFGQYLILGFNHRGVVIHDAYSKTTRRIDTQGLQKCAVMMLPNYELLACGSKRMQVYSVLNGTLLYELKQANSNPFEGSMASLLLLPNNQFATADGTSGAIYIWGKAASTDKEYTMVHKMEGHNIGWVCMLYLGSNKLLSVADDQQMIVWDIVNGTQELAIPFDAPSTSLAVHNGKIYTCFGQNLYVSDSFVTTTTEQDEQD